MTPKSYRSKIFRDRALDKFTSCASRHYDTQKTWNEYNVKLFSDQPVLTTTPKGFKIFVESNLTYCFITVSIRLRQGN